METREPVDTRENLKQAVIKRLTLVVFGCIALGILAVILPALYLVPVRSTTVMDAPPAAPLAPTAPPAAQQGSARSLRPPCCTGWMGRESSTIWLMLSAG